MNLQEKKYLMKRIDEITQTKIQAFGFKRTVIKKAITMTHEELYELVLNKKIKPVKNTNHICSYGTTTYADLTFIVDKYVNRIKYSDDSATRIKIYAEATKIKDQIMLGSAEEGLKMIKAFTKKKFK